MMEPDRLFSKLKELISKIFDVNEYTFVSFDDTIENVINHSDTIKLNSDL